jgi:Ca2+-binding RTX toxin-like protein
MAVACAVFAGPALAAGQFTFLQAPFTQELYGTQPGFMGGIAFAPDGDPLSDDCVGGGGTLHRFDSQTTLPPINGTSSLHPRSDMASNAGCGLTQAGGFVFTNTSSGVVKLNPDTGAVVAGPAGPGGNALGIAIDPTNQNVVWVGSNGTLYTIDQALTGPATVFSSALAGHFLDGIFFSPDGAYLFTADRAGGPGYALSIVRHDGTLAQSVPVSDEPDGIAFHASSPKFVLAGNTDGTITRFDFPGDDYSQAPTQSLFASGGFRSDLSQVGKDGCLYQSQNGTRYDNGTTSGDNSIVRICPGFAPPAGVEGPPGSASCSNAIDDDGDGKVDQADTDCQSPEGPPGDPSCSDSVDNDGDGKTDAADPGCVGGGSPGDKCYGQTATINGNGLVLGTPGDDVIITGNGADVVYGNGGNDLICTHGGDDYVRGGDGNDKISGGNGNDNLGGQAGNDVVQGGNGNDELQGESGKDTLSGGAGNDDLNGGEDNDTLRGEGDNDTLSCDGGTADKADGGPGVDNLAVAHGCETVTNVP